LAKLAPGRSAACPIFAFAARFFHGCIPCTLSVSTFSILRAVKYSRYDNSLLLPIDLVHHNIGLPRDYPFEGIGIATNMAN